MATIKDLPHALDAKQDSTDNYNKKLGETYSRMSSQWSELILAAIKNGAKEATVPGATLSAPNNANLDAISWVNYDVEIKTIETLRMELTELGYTISTTSGVNLNSYTIQWKS